MKPTVAEWFERVIEQSRPHLSAAMIFVFLAGMLAGCGSGPTAAPDTAQPSSAEPALTGEEQEPTQIQSVPAETAEPATPTSIPSPTPTPEPVEPGTIVIGLASLDRSPVDELRESIDSALGTASFDGPVEVRSVNLPSTMQSVEDIKVSQVAPLASLLVVWEPAGSTTNVYLLAPLQPPPLAQVGEDTSIWPVVAPDLYSIRIEDQVDVAADMVVGYLELIEEKTDEAANRFQSLQGTLFDMPGYLEQHNTIPLLFGQAQAQEAGGDVLTALQTLSRIIREAPDFENGEIQRGNVYLRAGDGQAALTDYGNAAPEDIDQPELLYNRALAHQAIGDLDGALADADQLVVLLPDLPDAVNLRGLVYYAREEYREALADFELAAKIDPNTPVPVFNQALTLDAMGDHGQALVVFDALIEKHPDDPEFYYYFGRAFEAAGEYEQAEGAYTSALDLDDAYSDAYLRRAEVRVLLGKYEAGVADAQRVLDLTPGIGMAYRIMGDGKLALEDFKGAQEAYTAAIEQDVRDPSVYAGRGYALQRQGLRTGALADYQQAVDLGVTDPVMLKRYGYALYDAGEYEDSLTVFTQAINGGLDTADGYAGYSIALDANIHRADAEEAYQHALELDDSYSLVSYLEEQPLWSDLAITRAVTILRRLDIDPYRDAGQSSARRSLLDILALG